jgi:hypothetical protein
VVDRFRDFLDRPLDPSAARAIVALALAICTGLAIIAALGGVAGNPAPPSAPTHVRVERAARMVPGPVDQDPQDRAGTAAHRRAVREVAAHRALQHVPYRAGALSIEMIGAQHGRAVLQVIAPSIPAARRGWRRFLRRFEDGGRAYIPRFGTDGRRG